MQLGAVQGVDRRFGFIGVGHFNEREPARLARVTIRDKIYALNGAVVGEDLVDLLLGSTETEVPDEDIGHNVISLSYY